MSMRKIFIFILIAFIFSGFLFLFHYNIRSLPKASDYIEISVILRGKSSSNFESIRQGIEQAANDMKLEVSFITLTEDNNVEEQKEFLEREFNNGAKAILISAADSDELVDTIHAISQKIPVISIESPVNTESIKAYITCDNLEMGEKIGKEVVKYSYEPENIVILESGSNCKSIQERYTGVLKGVEGTGAEITLYKVGNNTEQAIKTIEEVLSNETTDVMIALDTSILEIAAHIKQNSQNTKTMLFGIGATSKIASYLEKNIINTIVAPNGFNIGYLGVKAAVEAMDNKKVSSNTKVEFMVINSRNMYSTASQRLLFPFVR